MNMINGTKLFNGFHVQTSLGSFVSVRICLLPFPAHFQPESCINSHGIMNYVTTLLTNPEFKTTFFFLLV